MAIFKMKKIREMGAKDLEEKKRELYTELSKETASSEIGGTVKNPGRIREIRRTIARIKTLESEKQTFGKSLIKETFRKSFIKKAPKEDQRGEKK